MVTFAAPGASTASIVPAVSVAAAAGGGGGPAVVLVHGVATEAVARTGDAVNPPAGGGEYRCRPGERLRPDADTVHEHDGRPNVPAGGGSYRHGGDDGGC